MKVPTNPEFRIFLSEISVCDHLYNVYAYKRIDYKEAHFSKVSLVTAVLGILGISLHHFAYYRKELKRSLQ
ncbi:unnamed protein product [Schistosoma margrebowiei]|uniref:Uncharacterized protein n=1 Tax=Schistosoma margrebowiei TaxID=48269 RepID=A0AA85AMC0_9TREM|nr:unnamed protein product [Schistosoma margrebowiei]